MMSSVQPRARSIASGIILVSGALLSIGLISVASASASLDRPLFSTQVWRTPFGRQIIFALVALILILLTARIDYRRLRWRDDDWPQPTLWLLVLTLLCLAAVLVPGIGVVRNGARRWLQFGAAGIGFQPSEMAKLTLVLFLAAFLGSRRARLTFLTGVVPAALAIACCVGLVGTEDFGTAALLAGVSGLLLLVAGARWWHVLTLALPAVGAFVALLLARPYRLQRLTGFANIWSDPQGEGYHPIQSLVTIASGGWTGRGLGEGIQKYGYLPEARTDFVFAIWHEETGVIGALVVLGLFGVLLVLGTRAAFAASDPVRTAAGCRGDVDGHPAGGDERGGGNGLGPDEGNRPAVGVGRRLGRGLPGHFPRVARGRGSARSGDGCVAGRGCRVARPDDYGGEYMKAPLFVFAGGGSGGHLYPSLSVAEELAAMVPGAKLVFFGTNRPIDGNVLGTYSCQWVRQPVRPLPRRPWQAPGFLLAWRASVRNCRRFFREQRPLAVLGSGGYASGPPICEASRAGIPTALLNPDVIPGKANRYLGARVRAVFAQWQDTAEHFNGGTDVRVTGCPVRPEFRNARREAGLEHFGLDPNRRVLLITGASQGARSINRALPPTVAKLAPAGTWDRWQVLHLTGSKDEAEVAAAYGRLPVNARVAAYTKHMAPALAAADLVIARAGASTLAEITAMGRPSVLMPYPHHRDQHQVANARVLVKLGAARIVPDQIEPEANVAGLTDTLRRLLDDSDELARLADAARRIGTTSAATAIAQRLTELAGLAPEGPSTE